MSAPTHRTLLLVLLVALGVLVFCQGAAALPPAAGVQAGRAVSVATSIPKAREASLLCTLGTPVIGGTLAKGACEAGEKLIGKAAGELVGKAVSAAGGGVMNVLAEWMIGGAKSITSFVSKQMQQSTTPQLDAAWYQTDFAPMADLGAALALLVTLIALASAAARRDPQALAATLTGIIRAGLGTGLVLALTTLALEVADQVSNAVLAGSPHSFWHTVSHAWGASGYGGFESSALAMLIALVEVLCGLGVWLELVVRDAAIYVAVLFFPVVLAAAIWPALSAWTGRLGRMLLLLVIFKPVALIVLSLAGNAAAGGLSLSGGISGSVGTILAAIVIFALAALAPWALMFLLAADAESAYMAAGTRAAAGGAVAGSQGRSLRNLGGLRSTSADTRGQGGGGARRPGTGGRGGGGPSGGGGAGGHDGGQPTPPGGSSGGGAGEPAADDALPLTGQTVGAGSVGAAAGVAAHSRPTGARERSPAPAVGAESHDRAAPAAAGGAPQRQAAGQSAPAVTGAVAPSVSASSGARGFSSEPAGAASTRGDHRGGQSSEVADDAAAGGGAPLPPAQRGATAPEPDAQSATVVRLPTGRTARPPRRSSAKRAARPRPTPTPERHGGER